MSHLYNLVLPILTGSQTSSTRATAGGDYPSVSDLSNGRGTGENYYHSHRRPQQPVSRFFEEPERQAHYLHATHHPHAAQPNYHAVQPNYRAAQLNHHSAQSNHHTTQSNHHASQSNHHTPSNAQYYSGQTGNSQRHSQRLGQSQPQTHFSTHNNYPSHYRTRHVKFIDEERPARVIAGQKAVLQGKPY